MSTKGIFPTLIGRERALEEFDLLILEGSTGSTTAAWTFPNKR
jgi:hypothetical protein